MSSEIKRLGRHTLVYGAGVVISKLASFLMLPVYTRFLTPADYGTLELLSMTIDVIGTLVGLGLAAGVFKFYEDYDDAPNRNEVISTATISVVGIALVTSLTGLIFAPELTRLILEEQGQPILFRLFFLIYLAQACEAVPLLLIRAQQRSVLFVSFSVVRLVFQLTLNILFVVGFRMGVLGVLYGNLISSGTLAVILLGYLFRQVGLGFSREKFVAMVRFGYPMTFVSLGNFVLVFSDRYFLNYFTGTAAVGIYSLAYKFAFVLSTFAFGPFQLVWAPQRFAIAKRPDAAEIYTRVFLYLNLAMAGMALVISLSVRDLLRVMADPAFYPAHQVVPVVLAAQILMQWTAFSNLGFFLRNRTGQFALASLVGVAAVTALNALLIPRFGVHGAAWATLAAYAIRFLTVYALAHRHYPIHYDWPVVARLYAVAAAALVVRSGLGELPLVSSLVAGSALLILAGAGAYRFVLGVEDRGRVRRFIARPRAALSLDA